MSLLIHRSSGDPDRQAQLGPYRIETLLSRDEARAGTVYRVTISPGQRTQVSFHLVAEEYYFVLAGSGSVFLDGVEYPMKPGDFFRLPPGTRHGFLAGPDGLDLLDIHTPPCFPDHDTYFENTPPEGFAPTPSPNPSPRSGQTRNTP